MANMGRGVSDETVGETVTLGETADRTGLFVTKNLSDADDVCTQSPHIETYIFWHRHGW